MIRYISFLCIFLFLKGTGLASEEGPKLLYEKQNNASRHDWVYCKDMEQHRQEFFKWIASHGLWDSYARVILTVGCHDADDIPKCADAGKVFSSDNISYQLMHNGVKVLEDCYCGGWVTDLIYGLKGHHEPQEEKVFSEVLKYIPSQGVMMRW